MNNTGTIATAVVPVFPPGTNPYIVRVAREYLQYKPLEAELHSKLQ